MGTLSSNYPNSAAVENALNRANKAEVDIDSLKATVGMLDNKKADVSALDGINTALESKADASALAETNRELAQTNSRLETKADQSALAETNAVVAQKVDHTELESVTAVVEQKADSTVITGLQEQIDALITPVTQDAEVENARVGTNGVAYTTLKQRLDGENGNVTTILNGFKNRPLNLGEWVNGRYEWTTGRLVESTTRLCTVKQMQFAVGETIHVTVESGYQYAYVGWASGETVPSHYTEVWLTSGDFMAEVPFYCFMVKRADSADIEPSEGANCKVYSDYSLVTQAKKEQWDGYADDIGDLHDYVDSSFDAVKGKPFSVTGWVNAKYLWTTGGLEETDTRISSTVKNQFAVGETIRVEVESGYQYAYVGWNEGETVPTHYTTTWLDTGEFTTQVPYYAFMIRKSNDGTITTSESSVMRVLSDYSLVTSEEKRKWNSYDSKIDEFESGLSRINTDDYVWMRGKYSFQTGDFSSATNRISTTVKMPVRVGSVIHIAVPTGYNVNYVGWETGATVPTHYSNTWLNSLEFVTKTPYYCFMIRKSNDGTIGVSESSKVSFFIETPEYAHTFGRYKGKVFSILGDSISTFGGSPSTPNTERFSDGTYTYLGNRCRYPQDGSVSGEQFLLTDVKQTYWMRLIEDFGMTLGVNESWAGSCVSWDGTTESTDIGEHKHIASTTRIGHLDANGTPDYILINAGTNDIGTNAPIGVFDTSDPSRYTQEQIDALPVDTFANAYRTMLIRIQKAYPTSEIIVMLPNYTNTYYTPTEADAYCEIIKEACDFFGVKWVDMRACGITMFNKNTYMPDGTHYNNDGMNMVFNNLSNKMLYSNSGGGASEDSQLESTVRDIANNMQEIRNLAENKTSIEFPTVIGGLTTQGAPLVSTTRVRTYGFVPCNPAIGKVHFSAGTKHRFAYYSQNNTSSFISFSDWSTATEDAVVFPTGASYASMYILVGYTDDRTITVSNKPKIWYDYAAPQGNEVAHVDNYAIRALSANVQPMANFRLSTIIPVKSNTAYRAKKFRNTITLDENFGVVRSLATTDIENDTITTSATEKYIVFCWRNTEDEMYFAEADNYVEGRAISDLVPYPLIGKKLSLLGDSISSYAGTIPEGNDAYYTGSNSGVTDPSQMWWSVLCSKTGMTPLVINGWSGSGITQLTDSAHVNKVPMSSTSRCQALHVDTVTPDVVLIAGGVNDYSYANSAQHNPSNWDGKTAPTSGSSFTETYARMIRDIQEAYPSAIIICLSTFFTQRGTDNGYTYVNGTGYTQPDYDAEIEKVARLMRVGYVNMEQCGFNRYNFYPTFAEDSSTTPTHPNARGQRTMGEYLADVVPQIVNSFTKNKE